MFPDNNAQSKDYFQLEANGSVHRNGQCGYGGVIRDQEGRWICGYSGKMNPVPPAIAELMRIITGLTICWNRGFRNIFVHSNCIETINLITRGSIMVHPFRDMIEDVRGLFYHRDWNVIINHRFRKIIP